MSLASSFTIGRSTQVWVGLARFVSALARRRRHSRGAGSATVEGVIAICLMLLVGAYGMDFLFLAAAVNAAQAAASDAAIVGAEAASSFNTADVGFGTLNSSDLTVTLPSGGGNSPDALAAARASTLLGPLLHMYQQPQLRLTRQVTRSGNQITGTYQVRFTAGITLVLPFPGLATVPLSVGDQQAYRPSVIQRAV